MSESPIQNLDRIDMLGRREDGGVDLVIVVSGPLENTANHLERIEVKVRNYIREIGSPQFLESFRRVMFCARFCWLPNMPLIQPLWP